MMVKYLRKTRCKQCARNITPFFRAVKKINNHYEIIFDFHKAITNNVWLRIKTIMTAKHVGSEKVDVLRKKGVIGLYITSGSRYPMS